MRFKGVMCVFFSPGVHPAIIQIVLTLSYRMSYHSFQFLRCDFSRVTQIDLMMVALVRDIKDVSLLLHKAVHRFYCSGLIIISSRMLALYTKTFIISEEFYL